MYTRRLEVSLWRCRNVICTFKNLPLAIPLIEEGLLFFGEVSFQDVEVRKKAEIITKQKKLLFMSIS